MTLLILSFMAGVLTVAAPCILPLLPVVVGGTISQDPDQKNSSSRWSRPLIISLSLAVSIIIFTLLLKATTALLGVPQSVWSLISGGIVFLFGLNLLFPILWEKVMLTSGLYNKSNQLAGLANKRRGISREILLGASLGPVFSSCSPTYALIVAAVLPESFAKGLLYLSFYALGLAATLLLIAIAGQAVVRKLGWLSNPHGWFRRTIGVIFIVVGFMLVFGLDKKFQAFVLDQGWYDPIMRAEKYFER